MNIFIDKSLQTMTNLIVKSDIETSDEFNLDFDFYIINKSSKLYSILVNNKLSHKSIVVDDNDLLNSYLLLRTFLLTKKKKKEFSILEKLNELNLLKSLDDNSSLKFKFIKDVIENPEEEITSKIIYTYTSGILSTMKKHFGYKGNSRKLNKDVLYKFLKGFGWDLSKKKFNSILTTHSSLFTFDGEIIEINSKDSIFKSKINYMTSFIPLYSDKLNRNWFQHNFIHILASRPLATEKGWMPNHEIQYFTMRSVGKMLGITKDAVSKQLSSYKKIYGYQTIDKEEYEERIKEDKWAMKHEQNSFTIVNGKKTRLDEIYYKSKGFRLVSDLKFSFIMKDTVSCEYRMYDSTGINNNKTQLFFKNYTHKDRIYVTANKSITGSQSEMLNQTQPTQTDLVINFVSRKHLTAISKVFIYFNMINFICVVNGLGRGLSKKEIKTFYSRYNFMEAIKFVGKHFFQTSVLLSENNINKVFEKHEVLLSQEYWKYRRAINSMFRKMNYAKKHNPNKWHTTPVAIHSDDYSYFIDEQKKLISEKQQSLIPFSTDCLNFTTNEELDILNSVGIDVGIKELYSAPEDTVTTGMKKLIVNFEFNDLVNHFTKQLNSKSSIEDIVTRVNDKTFVYDTKYHTNSIDTINTLTKINNVLDSYVSKVKSMDKYIDVKHNLDSVSNKSMN